MAYKYFHNLKNRTVCRVEDPSTHESKSSQGEHRGWYISTRVLITRADNVLEGSRWKYPTSGVPHDNFGKRYSKEDVIMYFMGRVCADYGSEISSDEYEKLKERYETEAKSNRPSAR